MILYRIITEDKNRAPLLDLVNKCLTTQGFTAYLATGYWAKSKENSIIIEISRQTPIPATIKSIASKIAELNDQQAVLVQTIPCESELIGR